MILVAYNSNAHSDHPPFAATLNGQPYDAFYGTRQGLTADIALMQGLLRQWTHLYNTSRLNIGRLNDKLYWACVQALEGCYRNPAPLDKENIWIDLDRDQIVITRPFGPLPAWVGTCAEFLTGGIN